MTGACPNCGAYGGNGRLPRIDDTWDLCPVCSTSQPAPNWSKSGSSDLLTASEVKVLTETASKVAYALGRKDALTEIADEMAVEQEYLSYVTIQTDPETWRLLLDAKTSSQAAGATSDATSGVPGHPEVSEAARSPQEPPKLVCRRCNGYGLLGVAAGVNPVPCPDCALPARDITKGSTP